MLCCIKDDLCVARNMGVLDANIDLVKRGSNIALWWYMLLWAREQGAKKFNLGSSRAVTKDGVFNFKRQWGSRVAIRKNIHTVWSFYAQKLPEKLREHLNTLGIITTLDGKCYELMLIDPEKSFSTANLTSELKHAAANGLAGLVIISEKGDMEVISQHSN